jgi:CRP/FNR family transcriptional regulator, anaerobic regulatory protein
MNTVAIFQKLGQIHYISNELKEHLCSMLKEEHHAAGTLLLKAGHLSKRLYFIQDGFLRVYHHKAAEHYTTWFMGAHEFVISVYSFFSQRPSFENIEILEDSVLLSITWEDLQQLYKQFSEFNIIGRILTEQYYIRSEERSIDHQTLTAQQRYQKLLATHPQILNKASLGQIASYLGIRQETLSRIRAMK